ncbi:MAG: hypothetical protein EA369_03230 [Bradymonadales bacterium]|nr:MAG: hypothetical protein EA369_03230 [Bradymonadales bacterium]
MGRGPGALGAKIRGLARGLLDRLGPMLGRCLLWSFLILSLTACGSGPDWSLKLNLGLDSPSLVLLIRLDDPSAGQETEAVGTYHSNITLPPPELPGGSFDSIDYQAFLRGCVIEDELVQDPQVLGEGFAPPANSCNGLASYFGSTVFDGQSFSTDQERANLRLESDSRFVFILVFYGQEASFPDCLQVYGAEPLSNGFRIKRQGDFVVSRSVELDLPTPAQENCFRLFPD